MLQQLLRLSPDWLMNCVPAVLAWGSVVGILLWLLGGHFSRSMLTLLAITAGAWIGVRLPHLFAWPIETKAAGIFGAAALGMAAFLFHRTLIGVGLGGVVALWAVTAAWIRFDGPNQWHPVDLHWTGSLVTYLTKLWQLFPGKLGMVLPYACGAGLASGILSSVLWPRLSRCLFYSLVGTTLIVATGLPLAARYRPGWLALAPPSPQTQLLILLAFAGVGTVVQRFLCRSRRKYVSEAAACGVADRLRPSSKRTALPQYAPVVLVR